MTLTTYSCPKCGCTVQTLPNADVWHRCPTSRRNVKLKTDKAET